MKKTLLLFASLIIVPACDDLEPDALESGRGELPQRGIGKADGADQCEGSCGGQAPAGCWCDDQCATYGDCCSDKAEVCDGEPASCEGSCGGQAPEGCWCDDQCSSHADCCPDVEEACSSEPDPCEGVACDLPADHCDGDSLVQYVSAECNPATGSCEAEDTVTPCEFGCSQSECNPPPVASDDPFDPASCQGEPISLEQMVALFEPGASVADLGGYRVDRRRATCTALTGCGAWEVETRIVRTMWAGSTSMPPRELRGTARLRIDAENIELALQAPYGFVPSSPYGSLCTIGDEVECGSFSYLSSQQWAGSGGYSNYSSALRVGDPHENVELAGVLTDHCLRLSHRATSDTRDEEVALLVRF